ncbi:transposase [Streptomyces bobili]|uniref:transposase n=1 Tax=Streptomyces bobili TaxID=67280 RepID=UPI0033CBD448
MPAASRGYDGGEKVLGRKRHIVTDTLGLLLAVAVTAANIGDRDEAARLLMRLRRLHRDITLVWADCGYTGSLVGWCRDKLLLSLETFLAGWKVNGRGCRRSPRGTGAGGTGPCAAVRPSGGRPEMRVSRAGRGLPESRDRKKNGARARRAGAPIPHRGSVATQTAVRVATSLVRSTLRGADSGELLAARASGAGDMSAPVG